MSNYEEKDIAETRERLSEAGVLNEEGKARPVSRLLDDLAQDGGGVIDQEMAVDWSDRVRSVEDTVISVGKDVSNFMPLLKGAPDGTISVLVVQMFLTHLAGHLSAGIARGVFGTNLTVLREAMEPMLAKKDEGPTDE